MTEPPDDLAQALRDGLRALPAPEVGSDFDARVLHALRAPLPWWRRLWQPARPLILGASCSLSVTLVLLHWALAAPPPPILGGPERTEGRVGSLESLLDQPGLRAGSLAAARPWPRTGPEGPVY